MLTAYNQVSIPAFMYGTAWKKDATTELVQQAVAAGFTAIDTANQLIHYQEALVGEALLALAKQGTARERLFLQTKFTPVNGQDHRTPYDAQADLTTQVKQSFESSLAHLHTDYLDSYVLHGPYYRRGLGVEDWEVWAAIEKLYESGRTKMIGTCRLISSDCSASAPPINPWLYRIVATPRWGGIRTCGTSAGHRGSSIRGSRCSQPTGTSSPILSFVPWLPNTAWAWRNWCFALRCRLVCCR